LDGYKINADQENLTVDVIERVGDNGDNKTELVKQVNDK